MPINDPYAPPAARQPRMKILTSGKEIPGPVSFTVSQNNYYQADTMTATFAVSAGGQQYNLEWWGNQTDILLDIQASLDGGQSFQSLILAQIDRLTIDPVKQLVHAEGRDLTARFIDAKTRMSYQNQTSSQIAAQLAQGHGMDADVTATTTLVDRYYGADHDRMTLNQFSETTTEWDLLTYLAQCEDFDVWVTGTTLHFKPRTPPDADPYDVVIDTTKPWSNAIDIKAERSLTLAKDIVVAVRSWNSQQRKGFTVYNPNFLASGRVAKGTAQEFSFVRPNLTGQQALDLANRIRQDLSEKERVCTVILPADLTLGPRNMLRLRGTNSSWDQTYYIDVVSRSMSMSGFNMTVKAKMLPPGVSSQTSVPTP
jgi:hypothetical protein